MKFELKTQIQKLIPQNLTTRYVFALSTIALLAISGQVLIQVSLNKHSADEKLVRQVERQKLISKALAESVYKLQMTPMGPEYKRQLNEVLKIGSELRPLHKNLQKHNLAKGLGLREHFEKLYAAHESFVNHIKSTPMEELPKGYEFLALSEGLLDQEQEFRNNLERLVSLFDEKRDQRLNQFKRNELLLLVLILLVLLFEAKFIFRPAVKKLYEALEIRSNFLGRISHEIRNPMNSIIGMHHLLLRTPLSSTQKKYVETSFTASQNLLEMLNNLVDFSALESGKVQVEVTTFSLPNLIRKVTAPLQVALEKKGLSLEIQIDPNLPRFLRGDELKLRQILLNLLGNSLKFTHKGGVTLDLQAESDSPGQLLLKFIITDTGIGIPRDKLDSIFESFVQVDSSVKREYGGSGLGLSICRELTRLLGGSMNVKSKPGKGSTFSFTVPLQKISSEEEMLLLSNEQSLTSSEIKIQLPLKISYNLLLVDDSEENRFLIKEHLEDLPFHILEAANGLEALDLYKKESIDLILMDIQMPQMDGRSALTEIRKIENAEGHPKVPVIAVTAEENGAREGLLGFGFDSFVPKPINAEELKKDLLSYLPAGVQIHRPRAQRASEADLGRARKFLPVYLENRRKDLEIIKLSLKEKNFTPIETIGHRLKGNGSSFGLPELSELGDRLEKAAQFNQVEEILLLLMELEKTLAAHSLSKTTS